MWPFRSSGLYPHVGPRVMFSFPPHRLPTYVNFSAVHCIRIIHYYRCLYIWLGKLPMIIAISSFIFNLIIPGDLPSDRMSLLIAYFLIKLSCIQLKNTQGFPSCLSLHLSLVFSYDLRHLSLTYQLSWTYNLNHSPYIWTTLIPYVAIHVYIVNALIWLYIQHFHLKFH